MGSLQNEAIGKIAQFFAAPRLHSGLSTVRLMSRPSVTYSLLSEVPSIAGVFLSPVGVSAWHHRLCLTYGLSAVSYTHMHRVTSITKKRNSTMKNTVRARVRAGMLEVLDTLDLPEGTEVT